MATGNATSSLPDGEGPVAVAIQQPSFPGTLEDVDRLTDWAHAQGAFVIAIVNPTSLALLKAPGHWGTEGADIAIGEGQPLGVPLSSGGPYFGFHDLQAKARAADAGTHYRTHHGPRWRNRFCVDAASARTTHSALQGDLEYLHQPGPDGHGGDDLHGARRLSRSAFGRDPVAPKHHQAHRRLTAIDGIERLFDGPYFHEVALRLDRPVAPVLAALAARNILGGYDLSASNPDLGNALLVCATETKTDVDIDAYVSALVEIMASTERRSA